MIPVQAAIGGKIIARETIKGFKKDVLTKIHGGGATDRKRKLLEKQKKGKARAKQFGKVEIPQEAFIGVLRINKEGFSISRSNLINDSFVYVAESDNTVGIRNVKIIYYDEDSVIVSGLENNTSLISSYIPGIYKGMKIKISD